MFLKDLNNPKSVFDYNANTTDMLVDLDLFISKKEEMLKMGFSSVEKTYVLAQNFLNSYQDKNLTPQNKALDDFLLKLLYPEGIKNFLEAPANKYFRDFVAVQFFYLNLAASGSNEIIPYTAEEIKLIISGKADFYSDEAMIITARELLINPNSEMANLICEWLPQNQNTVGELSWIEMFLFAVILHAAWFNYNILNDKNRKLLLDNFLYLGAVVGINFEIIWNALNLKKPENLDKLIDEILRDNNELVLITANESKKFSEILKMYFQKGTDGYSKESYLSELYKNNKTEQKQMLIGCLRNVLNSLARFL